MTNLSMCVSNGLWMVGRFNKDKRVMELPRRFELSNDGKEITLSALPFVPPSVNVGMDCIIYPIPETEKQLIGLWERVTDPELIRQAQEREANTAGPRIVTGAN